MSRAYGGVAASTIEALELMAVRPGRILRIRHDWSDTGAVARTLDAFRARRVEERHAAKAELDVAIPGVDTGALEAALREATGGRVETSILDGSVWVRGEA